MQQLHFRLQFAERALVETPYALRLQQLRVAQPLCGL